MKASHSSKTTVKKEIAEAEATAAKNTANTLNLICKRENADSVRLVNKIPAEKTILESGIFVNGVMHQVSWERKCVLEIHTASDIMLELNEIEV